MEVIKTDEIEITESFLFALAILIACALLAGIGIMPVEMLLQLVLLLIGAFLGIPYGFAYGYLAGTKGKSLEIDITKEFIFALVVTVVCTFLVYQGLLPVATFVQILMVLIGAILGIPVGQIRGHRAYTKMQTPK